MKVYIKEFDVDMEVRTSGIEFEVRETDDTHLGDLVLTKTRLLWCPGKTRRENGIPVTWQDFIDWMNSRQP